MTKSQMRVAIAKDVIKLLKIRDFKVLRGFGYLRTRPTEDGWGYFSPNSNVTPYDGDSKKLQKAIPTIAKTCSVCARGAMILAQIHLFDGVDKLPTNDAVPGETTRTFGAVQADLIEEAFEGHSQLYGTESDATKFGIQYDDPRLRLRKIMQNIIVNNGTFKPKDLKNKGPVKK